VTLNVTDDDGGMGTDTAIVTVIASGDVNNDGCIDISDLVLVTQHWGETGPPGRILEDANCDGVIDISDLVIVAQHWREGCGN